MAGLAEHVRDLSTAVGGGVPEGGAAKLAAYVQALLEENRLVNLTAAEDERAALEVLLGPSLAVGHAMPAGRRPQLALDVGSGNGFPGVVVAARWPGARVYLVERRAKKARAIERCLRQADLTNVEVLACDVREVPGTRPDLVAALDLVTVRAVGELARTTRMAAGLLGPGGRLVHWKSRDLAEEERAEGARIAGLAGLSVLDDVEISRDRGRLVIYERSADAV